MVLPLSGPLFESDISVIQALVCSWERHKIFVVPLASGSRANKSCWQGFAFACLRTLSTWTVARNSCSISYFPQFLHKQHRSTPGITGSVFSRSLWGGHPCCNRKHAAFFKQGTKKRVCVLSSPKWVNNAFYLYLQCRPTFFRAYMFCRILAVLKFNLYCMRAVVPASMVRIWLESDSVPRYHWRNCWCSQWRTPLFWHPKFLVSQY